jgi:penicillin amidase
MKKFFIFTSLIILLCLSGVVGFIEYTQRSSTPPMHGKLKLPILEHEAKVYRDIEGIPHIYAKNRSDMYRVLGFTMASDRLFQYDIIRRAGGGMLSEILGSKLLKVDQMFRTFGAKRTFEPRLKDLPPQVLKDFEDFCAGLNYYAKNYPLPIEFKILGYKPKEFSIIDAYYVYTYLAFSFSPMLKEDQLHTKLKGYIKNRDLNMLQSVHERNIVDYKSIKISSIQSLLNIDSLISFIGPIEGSNAWLVGPQKTKSKKPILSSDPHINFSLPNIWYEAHVNNEEEDYEMYSHFLPLIPYPGLGHNRSLGWGLTMSYNDDLDLFKVNSAPVGMNQEVIKVKGEADYVMNFKQTKQGPVGDYIFSDKDIAINWAYYLKENKPLVSLYGISHSKDLDDIRKWASKLKAPGLNFLYADKDGNIAHLIMGGILRRSHPAHSNLVNPEDHRIDGLYPFDSKPHRINSEDFLISTNDRPKEGSIPIRGIWYPKNRHDSVAHLLEKDGKWTAKKMMHVQTSNLDLYAIEFKNIIINDLMNKNLNEVERLALKELRNWDGYSNLKSTGATIYNHFNYLLLPEVLDEFQKEDWQAYCFSTASWYFHQRIMKDASNSWWDLEKTTAVEKRSDIVYKTFQKTVKDLTVQIGESPGQWYWSKIHTIEYPHVFTRNKYLKRFFTLGPYPIPGAINVINHNRRKGCTDGHTVKSGPSTRRIVDFAKPELSWGILPLGNSGHQRSPFYQNQRKRFLAGKYRPQWMNMSDIEKNLYGILELSPVK